MTKEQLKKANELQNKINDLKRTIDYLEKCHGTELSICKWVDGGIYSSGYKHIITLDTNVRMVLTNYYKDTLKDLQKQLEEL